MISVTDLLDGEVLCEQTVASVVGSSLVSSRKCCSVRAPSHNCLSDPNLPFLSPRMFLFFQLLFMFCCSTCISAGMGFSSFFFGGPNSSDRPIFVPGASPAALTGSATNLRSNFLVALLSNESGLFCSVL